MQEYERVKTSHGEIDFNDILLLTCHILDDFPEEAAHIRAAIGWLTVDEYQDVSPLQHRLMSLWLNGNRDVCVVGDPAQTIYSFAGASSYDLLGFASQLMFTTALLNYSSVLEGGSDVELTYAVARACDNDQTTRFDAAGAILLSSENAFRVAAEAVQALGGAGYTLDWPVERYLRDAKLLDIGAGTNEIRRMLIGRELIGAAG